jgi:gliding motility-associated-like protein
LYEATVISPSGCVGKDSLRIDIVNTLAIDLGPDFSFCPANPIVLLEAQVIPGATYTWSYNGVQLTSNSYQILDTRAGVYSVAVTTPGGCLGSDVINVSAVASPVPNFSYSPSVVSSGNPTVVFTNNSVHASNFVWNFGDSTAVDTNTNPIHAFPTFPGQYYVTLYAYNGNCVDSVKLGPIKVIPVEEVLIPNAFTPNRDGFNELFWFPTTGLQSFSFQIFNRWGQMVFDNGKDMTKYWDGTDKRDGRACPNGVYVWRLEGKKDNGEAIELSGDVTVIR